MQYNSVGYDNNETNLPTLPPTVSELFKKRVLELAT